MQNTATVIARINRNDLAALDRLLGAIGNDLEKNPHLRFGEITSLHMAAFVIAAQDPRFSPLLIFESNFDGIADEYFRAVIARGRVGLDAIYSKCEGYPSGAVGTDAAVLEFLHQHSTPAAAFFVGLPGQTVASIKNAIAVREEINRFLDAELSKTSAQHSTQNSTRALSPLQIRDRIVRHLERDSPVKPEIPPVTFAHYRWVALRNKILMALFAIIMLPVLLPIGLIWMLAIRYLEIREQTRAGAA